ncbi:MAG TPA: hypothetical protein VM531_11180 [Sphingomicrobium sp.]|jgi:hypothetical protein|nr:hypothetical protein [Sphingomicrobium sp.]
MTVRIQVYDEHAREWRWFTVVPHDPAFTALCGNGIHQFAVFADKCACGKHGRRA